MHPILCKIGPFTLYTYGLFVAAGILLGYLIALKNAPKYSIPQTVVSDLTFWAILGGILFARSFYILLNFSDFLEHPGSYVLSSAGFVFYAGLIGGIFIVFLFAKYKKLYFFRLLDLYAPSLAIGHALGRIGCFAYGCCYGKPTNSIFGLRFPVQSPAGMGGTKVLPTQLFESGVLFLIFFLLTRKMRSTLPPGILFASYLSLYSSSRFLLEFLRDDPRGEWLFLSTSQWFSIILFLAAFVFRHYINKSALS